MRRLGEMEPEVKGNDAMGEMGGDGKAGLIWEELQGQPLRDKRVGGQSVGREECRDVT